MRIRITGRRSRYARYVNNQAVNNRNNLPRCNVVRANKSKQEMSRCGVASIFQFRPPRVESSSFLLLLRTTVVVVVMVMMVVVMAVVVMAHVHTHELHARTYIRSAIRKEHCLEPPRAAILPADSAILRDSLRIGL